MDKTASKSSNVAAWILYIINFVIMLTCVVVFAFGLWIISSPGTLSVVIDATGHNTVKPLVQDMLTLQVGIAVTAVTTFLFFVCFMGFYGAITRSPFLLIMYAVLVVLLLLLECSLLYYFSSSLVERGLQDDGQWTHALRLIFKCCEHNTSLPEERNPPWSCCGPETYPSNCTSSLTYKKDCRTSIASWLERSQIPIYSSLAALHILLASCSLIRRSCCSSRLHS